MDKTLRAFKNSEERDMTRYTWKKIIQCKARDYTPQMQMVLKDIESAIAHPTKILKDDATSTVVLVNIDNQDIVIKRANTKGYIHMLRRQFSLTRARKNWRNAHLLLKLGIPTFSPIAFVEERWGPLKGRSYFICSYIAGCDARYYFAYGAKPLAQWKFTARSISLLLAKLARYYISHRDLNLSNIILVNHQPWLIDLDSMRRHRFRWWALLAASRERARFMQNWQEVPGVLPETIALFQSIFDELDPLRMNAFIKMYDKLGHFLKMLFWIKLRKCSKE